MYQAIAVILLLFRFTQSQDANCDYSTNVAVGRTYYITSPNYPYKYPAGIQCRWIGICPSGYNCRVDCDVDIPKGTTTSCTNDRFLISRKGDPQLISAETYCGQGTISAVSVDQTIITGLISSANSEGGKLRCYLTAVKAGSSSTCNCGYRRMNRIVGGEETKVNEYTMMAAIVYYPEVIIACGGVIISQDYVATAAHCVVNRSINNLAVVVGEHDISTGTDTTATQGFKVASYVVHPQYKESNNDYDIAVVRVNPSIVFNDRVGPVCMPFQYVNWDFNGALVTLLGWGTTMPGGPTSKVLRKVDVYVVSQSTCQRSVPDLTQRQMCTFAKGKDACQNDSGGPVLYMDQTTGRLYFVGVISFGNFCASSTPGVQTRVTSVLNWIIQNAPADYCTQ